MALGEVPPAALTQRAREAQKKRRWAEAEALWRQLLKAKPNDRAAQSGLATVLLARGRIDEARALAEAMRAATPTDHAALALTARVAAQDEEWLTALDAWRAVLVAKPDMPAALVGVGAALIGLGDHDGAEKWAERLTRAYPAEAYGPALAARAAEARGDSEEALRRWFAAAERLPGQQGIRRELCRALLEAERFDEAETQANALLALNREEGLTQLGNVLARRHADDDHTDFWKKACVEFPQNPTFLRRHAIAAMKAGRADEATAAIDALLAGGTLWFADAGLIVGISHILAAHGDGAGVRCAIRAYLKTVRGSSAYRYAALRLSRTIFVHFAGPRAPGRRSYRERSLRMMERAGLRPKLRNLLGRVLAFESVLAAHTNALLDTDVSRDECRSFIAAVRERVGQRRPFSFVRINDAESNAFPYEPHLAGHFEADAAEREEVWWGRTMSPGERLEMSKRVAEAAWHADAIGVPNFARILRDVHLGENEDLSHSRTGRGLRTVLAAFERWSEFRPAALPPPTFLSANLHQDLQRWNLYGELFDGAGDLVLVSCHPDLPDAMKASFGTGVSANIVVPARHLTIPLLKKRAGTNNILPEIIDDVVARVRNEAPGRVVVVGAGYLGKWIVHQAKLAGGIALDVGSATDYWMGLKTRSYQDLA